MLKAVGFPSILAAWKEAGWVRPELVENTSLNQVTLYLRMVPALSEKTAEKTAEKQEVLLSEKQCQIFECMELEGLYKTEEIKIKNIRRNYLNHILTKMVKIRNKIFIFRLSFENANVSVITP